MVNRIRRIFSRSFEGLHEAALLLGISAFVSQLLALARDRIFAHQFGAGQVLDIYYASFKIPDFLFTTVASLVSMTILIPFFTRTIKGTGEGDREDKAAGRRFLDSIFSLFLVTIIVVAAIACFLTPWLAKFIVPGFSGEALSQFILLSRILLLQIIFLGLLEHACHSHSVIPTLLYLRTLTNRLQH